MEINILKLVSLYFLGKLNPISFLGWLLGVQGIGLEIFKLVHVLARNPFSLFQTYPDCSG